MMMSQITLMTLTTGFPIVLSLMFVPAVVLQELMRAYTRTDRITIYIYSFLVFTKSHDPSNVSKAK